MNYTMQKWHRNVNPKGKHIKSHERLYTCLPVGISGLSVCHCEGVSSECFL